MRAPMRRIGLLGVSLLLVATAAPAAEKKGTGTLAREAVPGRLARLAEIAKDATPPKPGTTKQRAARKASASSGERAPAIVYFR